MQYEISGSVLAGQITTTTWAGAPSRTWAWFQGDRWGWPRHRWGWPVRVVDQGGGSGGPGHGTPQAFNSAVDLPRARLGRRQRSIGPGRAVDEGGSAVDRAWARRGPGRLSSRRRPGRWLRRGPGHERLHSGAHSLCCCQQAVCRRGLRGGRAKGGAILTAQGSRRQCCAICLRGRLLRMCYLSNWRHFGG